MRKNYFYVTWLSSKYTLLPYCYFLLTVKITRERFKIDRNFGTPCRPVKIADTSTISSSSSSIVVVIG